MIIGGLIGLLLASGHSWWLVANLYATARKYGGRVSKVTINGPVIYLKALTCTLLGAIIGYFVAV